jgi:hypothetical protein
MALMPSLFLPPPPTAAQPAASKSRFKAASLKLNHDLLKTNAERRKAIPVDFSGDIVWDEATNGVFTLIVFWLIKSGKQILSRDSFPAKMEYVMGTRLSALDSPRRGLMLGKHIVHLVN